MNEVTQALLNGLLKFKEIKPKISSISTSFNLDALLMLGELASSDMDVCMTFSGFVDFKENTINEIRQGYYVVNFPKEISFNVTYNESLFRKIEWDIINEQMGYCVFQPENIVKIDHPGDKQLELIRDMVKMCNCPIEQLLAGGCICGGC